MSREVSSCCARIAMVAKKLPSSLKGLGYLLKSDKSEALSIGLFLEQNAERWPHHTALLFEDRTWDYASFNGWVNRWSNYFREQGIGKGDVVALLMENRPEVLCAVAALVKLGAVSALINTNQRGEALRHSLNLCSPKAFVVGEELFAAFSEVKPSLDGALATTYYVHDTGEADLPDSVLDLVGLTEESSSANPGTTGEVTLGDPCFYIYTSGTTGLPKASIMTHLRWMKACAGIGLCALALKPGEVIYVPLPLYHNNALSVGWSAALVGGAGIAIRRKFSASQFWEDTRKFNAVAFCYIGELCRYLMNQPSRPDDADNPVRRIAGNGLRPDLWDGFKARFGVPEVFEFYAASEGNVGFVNLFNLDRTVGMCPLPYAIVHYDVDADEPVRDARGFCVRVKKGGEGLLLGKVSERTPFDGYTNPEASERKLLRDVFAPGDVWFNSGDLMRQLGFRHAQFVDRLGDTFRWKGENVSTTEVDEVVNGFEQVNESATYGVEIPGTEGRAGMSSLSLRCSVEEFDAEGICRHLKGALPAYAVPLFLRVRSELEVTGTFKHRKGELKKQGYDIDVVAEPVYLMDPGAESYVRLTRELITALEAGELRF